MLKKFSLLVAVAFVMLISFPIFGNETGAKALNENNRQAYEDMVVAINKERAAAGLNPVKLYPPACGIAETRSEDTTTLFSHMRPDGTIGVMLIMFAGIRTFSLAENLVITYDPTPEQANDSLMACPSHRENILDKQHTHVAIGLVTRETQYGTCYYWTQIFLSSSSFTEGYLPVPPSSITGDINNNGVVDATDASLVLEAYANIQCGTPFYINFKTADVNCDGVIDCADAAAVMSIYSNTSVGLDSSAQCGGGVKKAPALRIGKCSLQNNYPRLPHWQQQ